MDTLAIASSGIVAEVDRELALVVGARGGDDGRGQHRGGEDETPSEIHAATSQSKNAASRNRA
jgi:hypothetical protein